MNNEELREELFQWKRLALKFQEMYEELNKEVYDLTMKIDKMTREKYTELELDEDEKKKYPGVYKARNEYDEKEEREYQERLKIREAVDE